MDSNEILDMVFPPEQCGEALEPAHFRTNSGRLPVDVHMTADPAVRYEQVSVKIRQGFLALALRVAARLA